MEKSINSRFWNKRVQNYVEEYNRGDLELKRKLRVERILYRRFKAMVKLVFKKNSGSFNLSKEEDDIIQDFALRAFKIIKDSKNIKSVYSYLYRSALNLIIDYSVKVKQTRPFDPELHSMQTTERCGFKLPVFRCEKANKLVKDIEYLIQNYNYNNKTELTLHLSDRTNIARRTLVGMIDTELIKNNAGRQNI